MPDIKDRIVELRRVPKRDLTANVKNWRKHPPQQRAALKAMLGAVGMADALIAREVDGHLVLLDGHLRLDVAGDDDLLPVLVVDVTDEEATKLLLTLDPLSGMAQTDQTMLAANMAEVLPAAGLEDILATLLPKGAGDGSGTRRTQAPRSVIQYNLQFASVAAQERWFAFLRKLQERYPAAETIASRLDLLLKEAK